MNVTETLTDLFLDANDFKDADTLDMGEHLGAANVTPEQLADIELVWEEAIRTHRDVLQRLRSDAPNDAEAIGDRNDERVPTWAELARLTDEELVGAIDACEASQDGCRDAVSVLRARAGGREADFWFGEDSPTGWFQRLADWFEAALVVLRRLRQWRALADHRTETQFQPLDPGSPSVLVQVRMPQNLLERLDAALDGRPRSDAIREAITAWLGEEGSPSTALVPHGSLNEDR